MAPQGKPLCGKESHMDPLHVRFSSQTVESICFYQSISTYDDPVSSVRPSEASSNRFLCFHPDSGGLLEKYWEYIGNVLRHIWSDPLDQISTHDARRMSSGGNPGWQKSFSKAAWSFGHCSVNCSSFCVALTYNKHGPLREWSREYPKRISKHYCCTFRGLSWNTQEILRKYSGGHPIQSEINHKI